MSTTIAITADPTTRRRSGGPKTEAGKRRASMNAVKHGMYSAAVVLPGESQQEYDALLQRYLARFQPVSPEQEYLVHTLVNAEWRINRLMHIQTARLAERVDRQKDEGRDPIMQAYSFEVHQFEIFVTAERHEARLHRDYDRALRRLLDIEKPRRQIKDQQTKNRRNELETAPPEPPAAVTETSETTNVSASARTQPAPRPPQPAIIVQSRQSWENRTTLPPDRPRICSTASPCTERGNTI